MSTSSIIFQVQSAIILGLLYFGASKAKKNRDLHVKIMTGAIIWDLLLVLQIELTRKAIKTATKAVTNPALLNFHIAIAVTVVVLYGFMYFYGRKILKGDNSKRKMHKILGIVTLLLRTSTFITSFMIKKS
jgi:chromate transport protein ChrA